MVGQAPADDASRAEIENQSQKGKAALKGDLGDIGDPHTIECVVGGGLRRRRLGL